jgi:hypothetical protein
MGGKKEMKEAYSFILYVIDITLRSERCGK